MVTKKPVSATKKATTKKVAAPKYKQLTKDTDFKKDLVFYTLDAAGEVNPIPVSSTGNLSQQATRFYDVLLRGGVYVSEKQPLAKQASRKKLPAKGFYSQEQNEYRSRVKK